MLPRRGAPFGPAPWEATNSGPASVRGWDGWDGSPQGGTDAERAATAAGYLAYAGRYTVSDEGVVEHLPDVSLFPNWEHTTVPRKATIAHDRLTLELVEPLIIDGKRRGGKLTWERVEVFEARTQPQ